MEELRADMVVLNQQKTDAENTLSSLHLKMDSIICERDGLASQLDKAVKELEKSRTDRNKLIIELKSSTHLEEDLLHGSNTPEFNWNISRVDAHDNDAEAHQNEDSLQFSPQKQFLEILNLSQISEEDIDRVCDKMSKAQSIISEIEKERKMLKKEVKTLRAQLENSRRELATVKQNCTEMNRQTQALRNEVDKTRLLLKESEAENSQMISELEKAQDEIERIKRHSSKSYNSLVAQSKQEISRLKTELKQKASSKEMPVTFPSEPAGTGNINRFDSKKISKYDISFETVVASNKTGKNNISVKSKDRFKIEKGQTMFGIF